MKEVIEYYNYIYGSKFINLEYPKTKKDIYRAYSYIKAISQTDFILFDLLTKVTLPKPVGIKETILYYECVDFIEKEVIIDVNLLEKINSVSEEGYTSNTFILPIPSYYINKNIKINMPGWGWYYYYYEYNNTYTMEKYDENGDYKQIVTIEGDLDNSYLIIEIFEENKIEREKLLKKCSLLPIIFRTYPVNTKIHFLEKDDTYNKILSLIYKGYNFAYKLEDSYIPGVYDICDNIKIFLEDESIIMRFNTCSKRITMSGVDLYAEN